ncbi:MAG: cytochrome c [Planctomycetales bacterium]|nr:cytochrome c [Planctomycetales bacterium]
MKSGARIGIQLIFLGLNRMGIQCLKWRVLAACNFQKTNLQLPNPLFELLRCPCLMWLATVGCGCAFGQGNRVEHSKLPPRVEAPKFDQDKFRDIFYDDIRGQLTGPLPTRETTTQQTEKRDLDTETIPSNTDDSWRRLISPESIEDLVKGAKLKLDKCVTNPAAFASGGFVEARKEFSLLAVLFAVIETYPEDVRWKNSASIARELMARVAANTKVGSSQVFQEAKQRLLDLADLLNGTALDGRVRSDLDLSQLIDRVPLMTLLEVSQKEGLDTLATSDSDFDENREIIKRNSELISVLGRIALAEEMPDAADEDYRQLAESMIAASSRIAKAATQGGLASEGRAALSDLSKSCLNCHDSYR